jgi:hypothetical protein
MTQTKPERRGFTSCLQMLIQQGLISSATDDMHSSHGFSQGHEVSFQEIQTGREQAQSTHVFLYDSQASEQPRSEDLDHRWVCPSAAQML